MFLTSVPDLLGFQRQTRLTSNLKARLEITSREAVTGRREDIASVVSGDVGSIHLLQKAVEDIEQDGRINAISEARLDLMSSALSAIRGVIGGLNTAALTIISTPDSFGVGTVTQQANANLRSVMSLLNTQHGNRKLFSGDATDQLPLTSADKLLADVRTIMQLGTDPAGIETALDFYFEDPNGGFATDIYTGGNSNAPPSFLADGSKIEFGVRADDQAIRDTLRGLAVLSTAQSTGYDISSNEFNSVFVDGASFVGKGKGDIIKLEASLGIYSGLLENANVQQAAERLTLGQTLNDIIGRDQFEAAAELKQIESQLEASYLVTARLANLNLTNFIR
jgi:flagellar hook-associated protein 3 FlgL